MNLRSFFKKTATSVSDSIPQVEIPEENIEKLASYIVVLLLVVLPLFFLPVLANSYDLPKGVLLMLGSLVGVAIWLLRSAVAKKIYLVRSLFDLPILLFIVLAAFSAYLTVNRVSSLASDPMLYAGSALLFFLIGQITSTKAQLNRLLKAFLLPAFLLSLLALSQLVVPVLSIKPLAFLSNLTPAGSPLAATILLAISLPVAIGFSSKSKKIFSKICLVVIVAGTIASAVILYKNPPIMLPAPTSWRIATQTIGRSITGTFIDSFLGIPADSYSALFGAGPGNFVDTFTAFKSADFNATKYWNLRFSAGANYYFYLLTTIGIAGLAAFLFLSARILKVLREKMQNDESNPVEKGLLTSLLLALIISFFSPAPIVLIISFFTILGILVASLRIQEEKQYVHVRPMDLKSGAFNFWPAALVGVLAILFAIFVARPFVLAEYYYTQSLLAAAANKGTETYNLQIEAINLNPNNDSYHLSYSQTNLALADSLASQANLSDQQKQAVITLVQQAIREARSAAALAPRRSANWENLSLIYRSLINFAQGADQWTLASLNQAINFDPTNPRLRLDLGGIYYANGDYTSAAQYFAQAVSLKSDYANAHYNLAQAYKNLKLTSQALEELQLASSLICQAGTQNSDCDRVNQEIASLGEEAKKQAETTTPEVKPETQQPIATNSGKIKPIPKVTGSPVKLSTPSGEITP